MSRDSTVIPFRQPEAIDDSLTEVAREGARRMLAQVLIAEADAFVAQWKDLKLPDGHDRVKQACEALSRSTDTQSKPRGLIVTYRDKQLPAKTVLRMAYCLANNIPSETKLKFASSESSLQLLRSLGFQADRLQAIDPVEKD